MILIKGNLTLGAGASLHTISRFIKTNLVVSALGKKVVLHGNALITGTLIAPKASCTAFCSMTVIGAVLCGKNIFFGTPSTVSLAPSRVVLPYLRYLTIDRYRWALWSISFPSRR